MSLLISNNTNISWMKTGFSATNELLYFSYFGKWFTLTTQKDRLKPQVSNFLLQHMSFIYL